MTKHVEVHYDAANDQFEIAINSVQSKSVVVFRLDSPEAIELVRELKREVEAKLIFAQGVRLKLVQSDA